MSTQPIIIQVVDQVDPTIAVKINGIGTAARIAAGDIISLQAALDGIKTKSLSLNVALRDTSAAVQPATQYFSSLGTAAQTSGVGLTGALTSLNAATLVLPKAAVATTGLNNALTRMPAVARAAADSGSVLEKAIAQLMGRAVGAEVGMGRLGGAIGRIGVLTAGAAPFIIAALAVGAVIGAVLWYNKLQKAAEDLAKAQTGLNEEVDKSVDKLLKQHETLVGLTEGPMAKYQAELDDLSKKSIDVQIDKINKVLDVEKSHWNDINTFVERHNVLAAFTGPLYAVVEFGKALGLVQDHWRELLASAEQYIPQLSIIVALMDKLTKQPPVVGPKEAQAFIQQQEQIRTSGKENTPLAKSDLATIVADAKKATDEMMHNNELANEHDILTMKKKIAEMRVLEKGATGDTLLEYQQARTGFENYLQQLYIAQQDFENNKIALIKGKNGEYLSEMRKAAADQLKLFREELDAFKASGGVKTPQEELAFVEAQRTGAGRGSEGLGPLGNKPALQLNQPILIDQESKLKAEVNKLDEALDLLLRKYIDSVDKSGAYTDAQKAQAEVERLVTEAIQKRIPITDSLRKELEDVATAGVAVQRVDKEAVAIYNEFQGPIQKYNDALSATNKLLKDNSITQDQANVAIAKAARAKADALDPLNEYKIGLQSEISLLGTYGTELSAATEVERVHQALLRQGYDLDQKNSDALKGLVKSYDQLKRIQQDVNQLYAEGSDKQELLLEHVRALGIALDHQAISAGKAKLGVLGVGLEMNKLNNDLKGGTLASNIVEIFGNLVDTSKTTVQKMKVIWTDYFSTLKKGFADSLAHALVFNTSIKDGLLTTLRTAVEHLISSFIQLGIELLIMDGLSKLPGMKELFDMMNQAKEDGKKQAEQLAIGLAGIAVITTAQLTAMSIMMAPAWALAEAVSLYSFGGNAAPAAAGIAAVVAAGAAAEGAGMFAEGGLIRGPGTGRSDDVLIRASNGEFVVQADATAKNRSLLEAINQGNDIVQVNRNNAKQVAVAALEKAPIILPQSLSKFAGGGLIDVQTLPKFADGGIINTSVIRAFADGGFVNTQTPQGMIIDGSNAVKANGSPNSSVGSGVKLSVNVVHDGTTGVKVEQIDANTVRIIARQEANQAVQTQGPKVMADELYNPNSHPSKAFSRNFNVTRKR